MLRKTSKIFLSKTWRSLKKSYIKEEPLNGEAIEIEKICNLYSKSGFAATTQNFID